MCTITACTHEPNVHYEKAPLVVATGNIHVIGGSPTKKAGTYNKKKKRQPSFWREFQNKLAVKKTIKRRIYYKRHQFGDDTMESSIL